MQDVTINCKLEGSASATEHFFKNLFFFVLNMHDFYCGKYEIHENPL